MIKRLKTILKISLTLVIATFTTVVLAQGLNTLRLEVPADIDVESYHVEQVGKRGVIIFYESNEYAPEKRRKWYFGLFDSDLNQKWLKFVPLEDKLQFEFASSTRDAIHFFFRNTEGRRNEAGYYEIVSLNFKKNKFEQISGTFPAKAEVMAFETLGNTACMGINISGNQTDLLFINLDTGEINPLKLAEDYPSVIEAVFANKTDNSFYVALKVKQDGNKLSDFIHVLNANGKTLSVNEIDNNDKSKVLRKFRFYASKNKAMAVFGVYDIHKGRPPSIDKLDNEDNPKTAGLFFFEFNKEAVKNIKFISFMKLDNIHGSINQWRGTSGGKNTGAVETGNGRVSTFFNINKPDIRRTTGGYLFNAEVYKPHYVTETRMDYDFYGRPYPYSYSVFAGYLFFDVIIVSIDDSGNMIWNNDFVLRDLRSFSLKRHSLVFPDKNYVSAAYVNNGKIYSKTFDGRIDIGSDETIIASGNDKDRVVEDENNHIEEWYDNYFLIYGYQKINNRSLSKKDVRVVFYMNKVAYK
ncbi:MAG: hypothetical protein GXO88_01280 [Chlorobi bacterium]|nr:hypothetical protein [Chlorobiota bacterium]